VSVGIPHRSASPGSVRSTPLVAWVVPGGALVTVSIIAGHTRHEFLGVPGSDVDHELNCRASSEGRCSTAMMADHDVVADQLVVEPERSVSHRSKHARLRHRFLQRLRWPSLISVPGAICDRLPIADRIRILSW